MFDALIAVVVALIMVLLFKVAIPPAVVVTGALAFYLWVLIVLIRGGMAYQKRP